MDELTLENILKKNFQKRIEFELNGKIYKKGKFILYKIETYNNNYDITFMFEKPHLKIENFKLPYPFNIEYYPEDSHLFFDYRIITLVNGEKEIEQQLLKAAKKYTPSKYFNAIIKIYIT